MRPFLLAVLLVSAALAGCATSKAPASAPTQVLIRSSAGDMVAELYADKAPLTVANFLAYVNEGFYTERQFYRIVPGFVTQGGGERQGDTGSHPPVPNEASSSGLRNLKYTLAMARTTDPDSATTEFFINAADNVAGNVNNLDPGGVSPDGYAVFGILTQGRDVADRLNTMASAKPVPTFTITVVGAASATATAPASTTTAATPASPQPPCPSAANAAPSPPGPVELDLLTPGVWNVCSGSEVAYAWVHNNGTAARPYTWNVTGAGGAALPSGWSVSFQARSGTLSPAGTKTGSGPSTKYPDWAGTRITLTIPPTQPAGNVSAELHAAGATRPFTFHVAAPRGTVSGPGSQVTAHYKGTFADTGATFDEGDFPLKLGSGGAVAGFDNGLMGLALGESASLRLPPFLHYGYDNPPGSYARFNGKVLVFDVTIKKLA